MSVQLARAFKNPFQLHLKPDIFAESKMNILY